jgi:hypothetical protein
MSKPYVYKAADACIRVRNCFKNDEIKFSFKMEALQVYLKKNTKKFDCPYKRNLTYVCNHNQNYYSAFNQNACHSLNSTAKSVAFKKFSYFKLNNQIKLKSKISIFIQFLI